MASCDDDFSLLGDDANHSQHHIYAATAAPAPNHRYASNRAPITDKAAGAGEDRDRDRDRARGEDDDEDEATAEEYGDAAVAAAAAFCSTAATAFCSTEFENDGDDRREKRKENRDDLAEAPYSYKKQKQASAASASGSAGGGGGGGEFRKDREEWSDAAIACLLDAYTEKFTQLNRGNLRGRDWEEVAAIVSERCERQSKSVEQCKNKVDNLKKRYKLERQRMSNGGISASHWPWFKKMEQIVGNSLPMKVASDEDKGAGSSANTPRQSKRFKI